MKILKYIIFLSILSGIFFVIYRQSDEKGFDRWWRSFKIAGLIAASAAGLIPGSTEAKEPPSNLSPSIMRQGQRPSNFPTPAAGGRFSQNVPGFNSYRTPPTVVDRGLGAAANPAGAGNGGGAPEFDDQCPVPENQKSQESKESKVSDYDYPSNAPKKRKQSAEQCELDENVTDRKIEIVYRIKKNPALIREAERMGKDQAAQKDVNNLIEQLSLGNDNPGIGTERVKGLKNVSEARGRNEGRVYFREKDGKIEILAKSNKDNQNKVIGILQKMGY